MLLKLLRKYINFMGKMLYYYFLISYIFLIKYYFKKGYCFNKTLSTIFQKLPYEIKKVNNIKLLH